MLACRAPAAMSANQKKNVFANDGSFMEMMKQKMAEAEAAKKPKEEQLVVRLLRAGPCLHSQSLSSCIA